MKKHIALEDLPMLYMGSATIDFECRSLGTLACASMGITSFCFQPLLLITSPNQVQFNDQQQLKNLVLWYFSCLFSYNYFSFFLFIVISMIPFFFLLFVERSYKFLNIYLGLRYFDYTLVNKYKMLTFLL